MHVSFLRFSFWDSLKGKPEGKPPFSLRQHGGRAKSSAQLNRLNQVPQQSVEVNRFNGSACQLVQVVPDIYRPPMPTSPFSGPQDCELSGRSQPEGAERDLLREGGGRGFASAEFLGKEAGVYQNGGGIPNDWPPHGFPLNMFGHPRLGLGLVGGHRSGSNSRPATTLELAPS